MTPAPGGRLRFKRLHLYGSVVPLSICGCIYQVTPEDLEADNGRLRCGICQTGLMPRRRALVDDDVLDGLLNRRGSAPNRSLTEARQLLSRRGAPCSFFRFSCVRTVHAERRSGAPRFQPSEFTFPSSASITSIPTAVETVTVFSGCRSVLLS